ncbi:hypothetical protein P4O66_014141, partial [Electrophorus voltai]
MTRGRQLSLLPLQTYPQGKRAGVGHKQPLGTTTAPRSPSKVSIEPQNGHLTPPPPQERDGKKEWGGMRGVKVVAFMDVYTKSMCNTRELLVDILQEYPDDVEYTYIPSCVVLSRCAGCCNDEALECVPTETRNITMEVLRVKQRISQHKFPMSFTEHIKCECRSPVHYSSVFAEIPKRAKVKKEGEKEAEAPGTAPSVVPPCLCASPLFASCLRELCRGSMSVLHIPAPLCPQPPSSSLCLRSLLWGSLRVEPEQCHVAHQR